MMSEVEVENVDDVWFWVEPEPTEGQVVMAEIRCPCGSFDTILIGHTGYRCAQCNRPLYCDGDC
jgi:hypothetical protein